MHAYRYHHSRRDRVTWAFRVRRLVAWRRSEVHDDSREALHPNLVRGGADQHVAWRVAGWVFSCRGTSDFPCYLRRPCGRRGVYLVEVFVRASPNACSRSKMLLWSIVPPNLSRRLELGKSFPFAQPHASPAALTRRPLAAG